MKPSVSTSLPPHQDEDWLPEKVKELGRKWLSMKLSEKEIESLKNIHITEYIMRRWCI